MRIRSRRMAALLLVAGIGLMAMPAVAWAQTEEPSGLGVFDLTADATGIGATIGDPNAPPYPTAAGLVPDAMAQFGAGPAGRALSSMLWPGPLAGNAGTLANLVVATPLPPSVLANANYPVKAEAAASGGGRDEQTVGPMSAIVDSTESRARTALSDFNVPGLVSAARVSTTGRSFLQQGTAQALAETVLEGVEIAGLIKIETVRTLATGTTDGNEASTAQQTIVSGVTIADQAATIDQDGIHLGGQTNPSPLGAVVEGAKPLLDGMDMRAFVTKPIEQKNAGGSATIRTGSVVFEWNFGGSGQIVTVVLGGATVIVGATPGVSFGDVGGVVGGAEFLAPPSSGVLSSPGFDDLPVSGGPSGGTATGPGGRVVSIDSLGLTPASSTSQRVPLGWVLIGLLGMGLFGLALNGFRDQALVAGIGASTCPLERRG